MRYVAMASLGLMLVTLGCNVKRTEERALASPTPACDTALLDGLLLPSKPEEVKTIAELRETGKHGDEVIVMGTVPPDKVKPFSDTVAAFMLMDAADLASEAIQNEFACDDADT